MEYDCVIIRTFTCREDNCGGVLSLQMKLPFAPYPGLSIGLERHSHFQCDELKIARVMWNAPNHCFLVKVQDEACRVIDDLRYWIDRGFGFYNPIAFPDEESAVESAIENELAAVLIHRTGEYHTVTPDDEWVLKVSRAPHTVLQSNPYANEGLVPIVRNYDDPTKDIA